MFYKNLKTGAMFELETDALRKQFGKLFLVAFRRLSFRLVAGQQATIGKMQFILNLKNHNLKTGAMFGLDARIALVIISALSIVTGASLINSLGSINTDKILAEASAIGIAVNNYHKDMNKSVFDTLDSSLTADELELAAFKVLYTKQNLIEPYTTKWVEPYISTNYANDIEPYLNTPFRLVRKSADNSTTCNDVKTNPCYVFLKFKDLTNDACNEFEHFTSGKNYAKVYKEVSSDCNILINIALDY